MGVGDAMREIDAQGLIQHDFILLSGDIVANMRLKEAVEEHRFAEFLILSASPRSFFSSLFLFLLNFPFCHRARRAKDKNVIMTMVVKEASTSHRIKSILEPAVMVFDKETKELLKYDIGSVEEGEKRKHINLDLEILKQHPVVQYRNDLLDCEIDICTPEVLALFTENFDYQHMRKHFVKGTLESDILGKKILTHIISDQYAARVGSLPSYDVIR